MYVNLMMSIVNMLLRNKHTFDNNVWYSFMITPFVLYTNVFSFVVLGIVIYTKMQCVMNGLIFENIKFGESISWHKPYHIAAELHIYFSRLQVVSHSSSSVYRTVTLLTCVSSKLIFVEIWQLGDLQKCPL